MILHFTSCGELQRNRFLNFHLKKNLKFFKIKKVAINNLNLVAGAGLEPTTFGL